MPVFIRVFKRPRLGWLQSIAQPHALRRAEQTAPAQAATSAQPLVALHCDRSLPGSIAAPHTVRGPAPRRAEAGACRRRGERGEKAALHNGACADGRSNLHDDRHPIFLLEVAACDGREDLVPAQWHVRQDQVLRAVALALALERRRGAGSTIRTMLKRAHAFQIATRSWRLRVHSTGAGARAGGLLPDSLP